MIQKSYVPAHAQVLTPYICPRDAARAIDWYVEVFDAVETGERFIAADGRVGHTDLSIAGAQLMISDAYPDYGAIAPEAGNVVATFALQLFVPDADATVTKAALRGAKIQRPVEAQFHGARVGTLVDPFGVRWMISTHERDVSAAELKREVERFASEGAAKGPVGPG